MGSSSCRRLSPPRCAWSAGASVHGLVAVSPPRGARLLPSVKTKTSAPAMSTDFGAPSHGPFTRYLRLATFLPAPAVVQPPKARFQLVVNPGWVGLATHEVPRDVSALSTSLPPHPGFAWRNVLPARPEHRPALGTRTAPNHTATAPRRTGTPARRPGYRELQPRQWQVRWLAFRGAEEQGGQNRPRCYSAARFAQTPPGRMRLAARLWGYEVCGKGR